MALEALPDNGKTSITSRHIQVTEKTIQITVKDQFLREVLQYIQNNFGIRFSLDDSVKDVKLSASINANNWQKALDKLLNDHNRSAILNDTGQLQHVFILGQRSGVPPVKNAYFIPAEITSRAKSTLEDQGTADAPPGISAPHQPYYPGPPQQSDHYENGPAKNSGYNALSDLNEPQTIGDH
ncbi:MAG: hypothetical protein K0U68_13905 [Gammaproteobacteria bacterium]|nr:hypothetical protein [Gammaproteobacteria bacterium]